MIASEAVALDEAVSFDEAVALNKALSAKADLAAVLSLLGHAMVIVASGGAAVGFLFLKAESETKSVIEVVADDLQGAARDALEGNDVEALDSWAVNTSEAAAKVSLDAWSADALQDRGIVALHTVALLDDKLRLLALAAAIFLSNGID